MLEVMGAMGAMGAKGATTLLLRDDVKGKNCVSLEAFSLNGKDRMGKCGNALI